MSDYMTLTELRAINREFRAKDDSYKWPIRGRFSVAERAIRQAGRYRADYGAMTVEEYRALLETLESQIVNDPRNW